MSRAPEVVVALLALFAPLPAEVCDGDTPSGSSGPFLYVGYSGNPNFEEDAWTSDRTQATLDAGYDEIVTVTCGIVANHSTPASARAGAMALFEGANDLIDANQSLGLAGITAAVPSHRFQCLGSKAVGFQGCVVFLVEAEAM